MSDRIQLIYFTACPHAKAAKELLSNLKFGYELICQDDLDDGEEFLDFSSPTIIKNGNVIFGTKAKGGGCSMPLPTQERLEALLTVDIRKSNIFDAEAIHRAHMRSIKDVCSNDYNSEQLEAWGNRPFNREQREVSIQRDWMYVVEKNHNIEGFGHMVKTRDEGVIEIVGLYFTPEIKGLGFGRKVCERLLADARAEGFKQVRLSSTITSKGFYEAMGFKAVDGPQTVTIRDTEIPCYPMMREL